MGKTVDMGSLLLQNESIRAVGNMGVNARGDLLDSTNTVIEEKNRQAQRQYERQTASPLPKGKLHTSTRSARTELNQSPEIKKNLKVPETKKSEPTPVAVEPSVPDSFTENLVLAKEPAVVEPSMPELTAEEKKSIEAPGLAGAIARSRLVKQEKEKSFREQAQDRGLKKI